MEGKDFKELNGETRARRQEKILKIKLITLRLKGKERLKKAQERDFSLKLC
jgi:hypothetical protein